ncbi:ABC transporter substrate-binding protein [uncultured Sphaerochaeta sp.]|uniref:ABC transporter substrate-binding protein n=1 Tax=uncultured Sphaerochaeta sp. TaxID=886478 RepID=UPI002A0A3C3A|nr:ABC transporter substrate-binding protein [uncultured Sphaerochaeta sp.]
MKLLRKQIMFMLILSLVLVTTGCTKDEQNTVQTSTVEKSEPETPLQVGMMSAVDAAPFYHALEAGYYEEEGVDVELVLFTNGQHRQTALQTQQVDGAMSDLVALITQSTSDFRLIGTLSTDGDFPLLASGPLTEGTTITAGTMEISVTNYLLDAYLGDRYDVKKVFINEIPARLEAVVSSQLDTGIFPEPFASIGALRNLEKLTFEGIPEESLNIIAFTEKAIQEKESQIAGFHRAYGRAVKDIQRDPELARTALMNAIQALPEAIRETMGLPEYHEPSLPSESFTNEIISWTEGVTGAKYSAGAKELFDTRFVNAL